MEVVSFVFENLILETYKPISKSINTTSNLFWFNITNLKALTFPNLVRPLGVVESTMVLLVALALSALYLEK